ncbi:unnamed protein product [Phytophthora fragariaefolia]|uniref:Unnamed protein product n=1 Tax=Phytophthora fragariaefolia TaxID=1490495 RepID=A0A9W6WYY2_9STRA|nr:unnamed protein product [Phytophthora fragariaefolia]
MTKNIQTFLGRPTLYPESSGVINDDAINGEVRRPSTNLDELLAAQLRAALNGATKAGAAPPRVKVGSAPEAPAHKRPDVRSERKAANEGETRRGAQPDAAKRAKPASAKSAERKGRDASSQNNKLKHNPKHRDSSDKSDSDSCSGSSDQNSDGFVSSSFEDVVPNVPTVAGPGGTMFTFRPCESDSEGVHEEAFGLTPPNDTPRPTHSEVTGSGVQVSGTDGGKNITDDTKKVGMVHGAVNNCRTDILLDSGASVSMMNFDLARRLKLRLKFCKQLRVSGLGGVPMIITVTTEVKINLGLYYGTMGVRRCAREGLVKLPGEEMVLQAGQTADHMGRGLDLAVTPKTCLYLGPGESAVVRIDNGQSNPQREVVWAGGGDRWVTQIIYAARSWPVAVKVVNVSDKTVWIDSRTTVARIVEFGFFLTTGRFVRPRLGRYKEWQVLIYENTNSK